MRQAHDVRGKDALSIDEVPSCLGSPSPSAVDPPAEVRNNECTGDNLCPLEFVEGLIRKRPCHTSQCWVVQSWVQAHSEGAEVRVGERWTRLVVAMQVK